MIKNKLPAKSHHPIMETHCHLDYLEKNDLENAIATSKEVGVDKIITIAVSPDNQNTVLDIAEQFDNVWATQGVHPHDAKLYDDQTEEIIKLNAQNPNIVAIGEIGLDYHYDYSPKDIQKKVFESQLQIAIDLNLPVIIHTREAEDDTKSILKNFRSGLKNGVNVHCFTSNMMFAEYALGENFYLGFNGIITFKAAENVREILKITPIDQILLETDAPYLAPVPVRGKKNAPFYLPYIAKYMCEFLKKREDELLPQIYKNSCKLFTKGAT